MVANRQPEETQAANSNQPMDMPAERQAANRVPQPQVENPAKEDAELALAVSALITSAMTVFLVVMRRRARSVASRFNHAANGVSE